MNIIEQNRLDFLKYMESLPDENFSYKVFYFLPFKQEYSFTDWLEAFKRHECGTVACLAGHCKAFFYDQKLAYLPCIQYACEFLGVAKTSDKESLFYRSCSMASKEDAIARLKYFIKHNTMRGYAFENESWNNDGRTN